MLTVCQYTTLIQSKKKMFSEKNKHHIYLCHLKPFITFKNIRNFKASLCDVFTLTQQLQNPLVWYSGHIAGIRENNINISRVILC